MSQNPFDFFDAIFVINLDRRPDRWENVQETLKFAALQDRVIRVPGVNLPDNPARGNHLSHAKCLRLAKDMGAKNALIFEDDVEWLENPWIYLNKTLIELPEDWGLFYLGVNTEKHSQQVSTHLARLSCGLATHAYAINGYLFDRIIDLNENRNDHNDVLYSNEIIPNYPCFASIPLLAGQRKNYSDIMRRQMESNGVFRDRFYGNLIRNRKTLKPDYVTFITPTLGRTTLPKAINSIVSQPDWNWESIIIFDGVKPNYYNEDEHIHIYSCDKKNHAGLVRNEGFKYVDTRWIAFLDDDDLISQSYIQKLRQYESSHPECDIIIFTYRDLSNGNTQPPLGSGPQFEFCHVGISFAVKTEFVRRNDVMFRNIGCEDFHFLNECQEKGAKHFLTNDIQYYVLHRSAWN